MHGTARGLAALWLLGAVGCVSTAEFRELERDVREMKRGGDVGERVQLADLMAEVDQVQAQLEAMQGRIEVAEHRADRALEEAESARREATRVVPMATSAPAPVTPAAPESTPGMAVTEEEQAEALESSVDATAEEIQAYRAAHAAWRNDDTDACIDQFRNFLQTNPSSAFADDAAFWMADCYFKQGDYKTAILRFDDVVSRYPTGNKAADALYRQGEALLRLGPGYSKAAGKAFERVIREYPDSDRAMAAKRQLDVLGSG